MYSIHDDTDLMVKKAHALESMRVRNDPNYQWALGVYLAEMDQFKARMYKEAFGIILEEVPYAK